MKWYCATPCLRWWPASYGAAGICVLFVACDRQKREASCLIGQMGRWKQQEQQKKKRYKPKQADKRAITQPSPALALALALALTQHWCTQGRPPAVFAQGACGLGRCVVVRICPTCQARPARLFLQKHLHFAFENLAIAALGSQEQEGSTELQGSGRS